MRGEALERNHTAMNPAAKGSEMAEKSKILTAERLKRLQAESHPDLEQFQTLLAFIEDHLLPVVRLAAQDKWPRGHRSRMGNNAERILSEGGY